MHVLHVHVGLHVVCTQHACFQLLVRAPKHARLCLRVCTPVRRAADAAKHASCVAVAPRGRQCEAVIPGKVVIRRKVGANGLPAGGWQAGSGRRERRCSIGAAVRAQMATEPQAPLPSFRAVSSKEEKQAQTEYRLQ